jgi:hypothetical protein
MPQFLREAGNIIFPSASGVQTARPKAAVKKTFPRARRSLDSAITECL